MNELRERSDLQERDVAEQPFILEQPKDDAYHYPAAPPPLEAPRRQHLRGVVGPTILIGAGAVLLLNTTGLVDWDIWAVMWRLWPVILIAVGLDILIGRRSLAGSALVAATMAVIMIGGAWALASGLKPAMQESIAQSRNGISRADVTIVPAVADLRIAAGSDGTMLVSGTIERAPGERLAQDYQRTGGLATYTLASAETRDMPFGVSTRDGEDMIWDLRLAPDLPLSLNVKSGIGKATIDLTGLQLTGLDVNKGVGQTTVILPARGQFSAKVDTGVGEVIVRVPAGMALRVHISAGLGNTQIPSGYTRQGDVYLSPGYDAATNRIELEVNGGIGRVAVEETAGR